jgi:tetratricopeptide (TPR) repeat protein
MDVADGQSDPVAEFRGRLQEIFGRVRRPAYRNLEAYADRDGRVLRISTVSNLLNGPGTPRWGTVETFVRACGRYASARQILLPPDVLDLDRWHRAYREMENSAADEAAERERVTGRPPPAGRRTTSAVPGQLPSGPPAFTGRADQLAELDTLLERSRAGSTASVIGAVSGTAGVGKTALALHWARRAAGQFPDGQLYVNLRGFAPDGEALDPAIAVRGFLDALEVPPQRIPVDVEAQAALYRSLLAGKWMLILLDNARDSAQVRLLLPGDPHCLTLVTSRCQLSGLVAADGAHPVCLDLLSTADARDLLASRLAAQRIAAEPEAAADIIAACARLPLALTVAAAHAALRPRADLGVIAAELRDSRRRWQALAGDEPSTDVRAVFSWSYDALGPDSARLFRLLGLHPGPDIGVSVAAALAALTPARVRPLLAELIRTNLITEHTSGRYVLHDLLRAYASEMAAGSLSPAEQAGARHRMLDHYLRTAAEVNNRLDPRRDAITLPPPVEGVSPEEVATLPEALDWADRERAGMVAAIEAAQTPTELAIAWRLAWCTIVYFDRRGYRHDWVHAMAAGLAAALAVPDPVGAAWCHRGLAQACSRLGWTAEAVAHLSEAMATYQALGDPVGLAYVELNLACVVGRQGENKRALGHAHQAMALFRSAGQDNGHALSLNAAAWCNAKLGEYAESVRICREALRSHQIIGSRIGEAEAWDTLGLAWYGLGRLDLAENGYQRSLKLFRELGDLHSEARELVNLGETRLAAADARGKADLASASAILRRLGFGDRDEVDDRLAILADAAPFARHDRRAPALRGETTG